MTTETAGASNIAQAALSGLLESERTLRQWAEAEALAARAALEGVAQTLSGDFLEVYKAQLPGLSVADLGALVAKHLRAWHARGVAAAVAAAARSVAPAQVPAVARSAAPKIVPSQMQAAATAVDGEDDEDGADSATAVTLDLPDFVLYTEAFVPAAPVATHPVWFAAWFQPARSGFDNDFAVLQILGRTGDPYRSRVVATAAHLLHYQHEKSGSIKRALDRLVAADLVLRDIVPWKRVKPHLLALSSQGQDVYRLLFGQEPAPQLLTVLKQHHRAAPDKPSVHVYLILETARHLQAAGYTVELFPQEVDTPGGQYCPDLVATFEGQTLYLEAETDAYKGQAGNPERQAKWARYWNLTHGQFYLSIVDRRDGQSLLSELRYWARAGKRQAEVRILEAGQRTLTASGWDIWECVSVGE